MKKALFPILLCAAVQMQGQIYFSGNKLVPSSINNEGVVVGTTDKGQPFLMWNPYDNSIKNIGGESAGKGSGGNARFTGDGKRLVAPMANLEIELFSDWLKQSKPEFDFIYNDIVWVSDNDLFAIGTGADGKSGIILSSTTNGMTWQDKGYLIDDGYTWQGAPEFGITCLSATYPQGVFAGTDHGKLYAGSRSGTWREVTTRPADLDKRVKAFRAMDFIYGKENIRLGQKAKEGVIGVEYADGSFGVWHTQDGGTSFNISNGAEGIPLYITHAGECFFMTTQNGLVQKSEDKGKTWTVIYNAPEGANLHKIRFADEQKGIIISGNKVYITRDGGNTWTQTEIASAGSDVKWNDARWSGEEIVVAGTGGNAYLSTDDGKTFAKMDFDTEFTGDFMAVHYNDLGIYSFIGKGGLFYYKAPESTTEGYTAGWYDTENETWTPLPTYGFLNDMSATSPWGVSGDGNTVVGLGYTFHLGKSRTMARATIWQNDQIAGLDGKFIEAGYDSRANNVNYDGSIIVGWQAARWGTWYATVWRKGTDGTYKSNFILKDKNKTEDDIDFEDILNVDSNIPGYCEAISSDGKWIGGSNDMSGATPGAWIWNEDEGLIEVTESAGSVKAISNDGSFAVGDGSGAAWIWTKEGGLKDMKEYVTNEMGCDIGDYAITASYGISPNGRYIACCAKLGTELETCVIDLKYGTTSIDNVTETQTKASIYPDPVADELHIDLPYTEADINTTLTLIDMKGCTMRRIDKASTSNVIDVSSLTEGIYILDVNANGTHKAFKVVVRH